MLLPLTCAPGAPATHLCTRCYWYSPVHQMLLTLTCAPGVPAAHLCTRCSWYSPMHQVLLTFTCAPGAPAAYLCTMCLSVHHMLLSPTPAPRAPRHSPVHHVLLSLTEAQVQPSYLFFFFPLSTIWLTPAFQNPSRVGCKTFTDVNKWLVKHRAQSYWGTPMRRNSF